MPSKVYDSCVLVFSTTATPPPTQAAQKDNDMRSCLQAGETKMETDRRGGEDGAKLLCCMTVTSTPSARLNTFIFTSPFKFTF